MITALVLAAGLGRRLRTVTHGPKWLVPVGPTTPMQEQLAAIDATQTVDRVVVIVSGDTSALRELLATTPCRAPVDLVDNPDAERWNNWSSALTGFEQIDEGGIVLFNSDLFASRAWLTESLQSIIESPTPALLIDGERPLTDEAMKVVGGHRLSAVGKTDVDPASGEYVGMAWWPEGTTKSLRDILRSYRGDPNATQNWYEHGIQADIGAGSPYARVATPSVDWVEIDDERDHRLAEALIGVAPMSETDRG